MCDTGGSNGKSLYLPLTFVVNLKLLQKIRSLYTVSLYIKYIGNTQASL